MTVPLTSQSLVSQVMRSSVVSIEQGASLSVAARVLRSTNIGALAVMEDGELTGVLSERDIVAAIAQGRDPAATRVSDAMAEHPRYVTASDHVSSAVEVMLQAGVRHLPVIEDGELVGMVSIRDVAAVEAAELAASGLLAAG